MSVDLGELFIKLGFKVDSSDNESVKNFNSNITALSTGFIALKDMSQMAISGINSFLNATTGDTAKLESLRNMTNLNIDSINKFRVSLSLLDPTVSLDQGATALANFAQKLETAKVTGQGWQGFRMLFSGVNQVDDATTALEKLRIAVQKQEALGVPKARISQYLAMTGLPPESIKYFEQTKEQLDKLLNSPKGKLMFGEASRQDTMELVKANQTRIIIPTVYRDDYLGALRRLTRNDDPAVYIKMLQRAQEFSATLLANDMEALENHLTQSNAFKEHDEAKLKIITTP